MRHEEQTDAKISYKRLPLLPTWSETFDVRKSEKEKVIEYYKNVSIFFKQVGP